MTKQKFYPVISSKARNPLIKSLSCQPKREIPRLQGKNKKPVLSTEARNPLIIL